VTTVDRSWHPWTPSENAYLLEKRAARWTIRKIAAEMRLPFSAVKTQAVRLAARKRRGATTDDGSLVLLAARANELCWDLETLGALLARHPGHESWREALVAMAARVNEMYAELARLRDRGLER